MSFYPETIERLFAEPRFSGDLTDGNATGRAASFVCGSAVHLSLQIDVRTKEIVDARFRTNGCGFMIAAAEAACAAIRQYKLTDLNGADDDFLYKLIDQTIGDVGEGRRHCTDAVLQAIHRAFADFREFQIEEFSGEKALICTCFGVSEDDIENIVSKENAVSVEEVGEWCNAGTGCGSCQPLIQEIIDSASDIFNRR